MGKTRSILNTILVTACYPLSVYAAVPKEASRIEYGQIIETAKKLGAKDPHLVLAIVKRESEGIPSAVPADKSSHGLMQLKLRTARYMGFRGKLTDLYNWKLNLKYGIRYLNYQIDRYDGDIKKAVSAYNGGHAMVNRGRSGFKNQAYVNGVLSLYRDIKIRYNDRIIYTLVALGS